MIHSDPKNMTPDLASPSLAGIGHNGCPAPVVAAPQRRMPKTMPFGLRAAWLRFAEELELRRLAVLHMRIERKQAALDLMIAERQRIMNRCIRRMRRKDGKN